MSELTATTAEPAYINRLALTHSPFTQFTASAAFYDGSHIKQRRLLLQHLLRATTTPVLLSADKGMGKTTLLAQLQQQPAADIQYCVLPASGSRLALCQAVLSALQADSSDNEASCEAALKQRLLQLRRVNIVPVLLVDDAETLPEPAIAMLTDWLQWQGEDQQSLWQAIISVQSEPVFAAGLSLQKLDMPTLEAYEVSAYLMQRLQAAGYQGELPFTSRDLHRFYRQSGGNPGKINQLAHQQLLGTGSQKRLSLQLPKAFRQIGRWSVVLLVALIILAALLFQQQINHWIDKPASVEEPISLPPLAHEDDVAKVVVGEDEPAVEETPRQELADLLSEIPPPQITATVPAMQAETDTQAPTNLPEPETAADPQAMPATVDDTPPQPEALEADSVAETDDSDPPAVEVSPAQIQSTQQTPVESASSGVHGRDWIMQQPTGHYTFQLMGAWDAAEVDEFIEKYALSGEVASFTSLRDDKPWHVLVYGVYPSRKAALNASNKWPAPLNTIPTWLRRFDSVQKQISEKGVSP